MCDSVPTGVYKGDDGGNGRPPCSCDATDVDTLARVIWFDPEARAKAEAVIAGLPGSLRERYPTPEAFCALVIVADSLIHPPPVPEVSPRFETIELSEGRAVIRIVGSKHNFHEYQHMPEGWKFVMLVAGGERLPNNLNHELLVKLSQRPWPPFSPVNPRSLPRWSRSRPP